MTVEDPRDAAMRNYRLRQTKAAQTAADQARGESERAKQREQWLTLWATKTFHTISNGVNKSMQEFARRQCEFIFAMVPTRMRERVIYEIRGSGQLERLATLTFILGPDGLVLVQTDAHGANLPGPVVIQEVTTEWAEKAADKTMIAVLNGSSQ